MAAGAVHTKNELSRIFPPIQRAFSPDAVLFQLTFIC
jgi:hypothetical protein